MFLQKRSENDTRTLKLCKIRKKEYHSNESYFFFPFQPEKELKPYQKNGKAQACQTKRNVELAKLQQTSPS